MHVSRLNPNKQQAAEFLGVSVRALERYVQQGRISVKYEKGKTRSTANFDSSELEGLKDELNQPTIKPAFVSTEWVRMIALGSFDFFRKTNLVVKIPINELYP